jgi:four helix bundle protein
LERRSQINSYRDLLVWKKGMALVKNIYQVTKRFPEEEKFGLVSQMRRAAVSVPSNIAEGQSRRGRREFVQFLSHAEGSLAELDTQVLLSVDLGYCAGAEAEALLSSIMELQKMATSLRQKISRLV